MPKIKASSYSKISQAHSFAIARLEEVAKIDNLPKALKDEVSNLVKNFQKYDLDQHREAAKILTGKIMTPEELKEIIVDATGYTKWELSNDFDDDEPDHSYLLKHYGVDVKDKNEIMVYHFTRKVNSRNDLWLIRVTCLPGHVDMSFDTDRANWGPDTLVPNADIKKTIEANCD